MLEKTSYETGKEILQKLLGETKESPVKNLGKIAPDLDRYAIADGYGDIYSRDGLSLQEREMVTLTSLLTLGGCEKELEVHIRYALNVGVEKEKIVEIFMQCILYAGMPRVVNALGAAEKVFSEREEAE